MKTLIFVLLFIPAIFSQVVEGETLSWFGKLEGDWNFTNTYFFSGDPTVAISNGDTLRTQGAYQAMVILTILQQYELYRREFGTKSFEGFMEYLGKIE